MSKNTAKNVAKNAGAPKNAKKVKGAPQNVFLAKGATKDALKGRVGARTHAMHVVLLDAARVGALLALKEIVARATALMRDEQDNDDAQCNAAASHINTMRKRNFVEHEQGAWRLTDEALELCGATWAQDADAPAKRKKGAK